MGKNHRLVIARKARNMNRPDLAGELRRLSAERKRPRGTAPSGVLRWEDGRKPELETQKLLAELFDIDPHLVGTPPWPDSIEPLSCQPAPARCEFISPYAGKNPPRRPLT